VRVVLDTSTVLSALLLPRGRVSWIRDLWTVGRIVPLVCRATIRELVVAFAYSKFKLDETEIQTLLTAYLPFTETIDVSHEGVREVRLSHDPDERKLLHLAATGRAQVLVSGDRAILELAARVSFAIETAAEFRKRFA